ncbi:MAG: MFS transporter [Saprospiraceae bacterium]
MENVQEHSGAKKHRNMILFAGIVGNVLEWYDFAVYGFFAPVLGKLFFPSKDPVTSLIASFGAFAAGFLMRPIGGAFFGYIGDRIGRKRALNLSVVLMALPTFTIGLMPVYAQIGILAPVMLVLLRMLQGLSVGGEFTSSIVYLSESAPKGKRGLFSSASMFGAFGGILLGSFLSGVLSNTLEPAQIAAWGWRVPFLIGIVVAAFGYLIRRHMPETLPAEKKTENPLRVVRKSWRAVLMASGLNLITAVSFYIIFVFVITWLVEYVHEARTMALRLNTLSMIVMMICCPVAAWLSDKFRRKPVMIAAAIGMVVLAYPLIWLMHHQNTDLILLGQLGMALLFAMYVGPLPAALTEMFPGNIRVSAVSVGYNLTYAIFGGTAPMFAIWLINKEHDDMAFVWYIAAAAAVSLFVTIRIPETAHSELPE